MSIMVKVGPSCWKVARYRHETVTDAERVAQLQKSNMAVLEENRRLRAKCESLEAELEALEDERNG